VPPLRDRSPSSRRAWWCSVGVVALVGLGARVAYTLTIGADVELGADALWYSLQAAIVGDGRGYLDPQPFFSSGREVATASFPPLWPALLGAVDAIGPGSREAFQLVGAFVGTVTVALTAELGRRVVGPRVGIVSAAIVALSPAMVAADGSLMADSACVALLVGTAVLASRALDEPTPMRFALMGMSGGLAVLTRNDSLVVVVLLAGVAAFGAVRADVARAARLVLVTLGVVAVLVVPWSVRNSVRFGQPVALSTNLGTLVEGANCATTYDGSLLGMWDERCQVETRRRGRSEAEWSEAGLRRGFAHLRNEPERVPLVAATRVVRALGLWNPYSQVPLEAEETRDEGFQLAAWIYGLLTLLVAAPGAVVLARRRGIRALPLAAMVGGTLVVVVVSWGNPRFRLPAEPAFAIAAAVSLCTVLSRRAMLRA
jgi:4-amino-4-deoxy-L-arabinose transferase-like glycosyltransferase